MKSKRPQPWPENTSKGRGKQVPSRTKQRQSLAHLTASALGSNWQSPTAPSGLQATFPATCLQREATSIKLRMKKHFFPERGKEAACQVQRQDGGPKSMKQEVQGRKNAGPAELHTLGMGVRHMMSLTP